MTGTGPDGPTETPDKPDSPGESSELTGNVFHGPTALQVGTGNTMNVRYDVTAPSPSTRRRTNWPPPCAASGSGKPDSAASSNPPRCPCAGR